MGYKYTKIVMRSTHIFIRTRAKRSLSESDVYRVAKATPAAKLGGGGIVRSSDKHEHLYTHCEYELYFLSYFV